MHPDECRIQILSDFDDAVLRDMATLVGRAYPQAHRLVRERYGLTVARDHYPLERRAMIEEGFGSLANRHRQLRVVPATNKKETSHYFRLSHNRSVLTQSKTEGPLCLPRDADFRRTLAKTPQLALEGFDAPSSPEAQDADAVYGVLAHGPDEEDSARVAFIRILIPDAAGQTILSYIDLFHFWDEGRGPVAFPTVPIVPAAPKLKIARRDAEEGSGA